MYSFGAISDVHLQHEDGYNTGAESRADFQTALSFLESFGVDFITICGDLTTYGTADNLTEYKSYVYTYAPNTPVYAITGNHEAWGGLDLLSDIVNYTGQPLYYSFTKGDDVFIMVGIVGDSEGGLFVDGELQWLYEVLETNRNKRCFVFEHVRPQDGCGNSYEIYNYDIWGGTEATVFESLMRHYHNVVLFHGHSHMTFNIQTKDNLANLDYLFGCWSVHIPSISVPRTGDVSGANSRTELYAESEGYVIDVYENYVLLRGRDFKNEQWLPIATYCIDTTLVEVEAGTYTDSTGTITT